MKKLESREGFLGKMLINVTRRNLPLESWCKENVKMLVMYEYVKIKLGERFRVYIDVIIDVTLSCLGP